MYDHFRRQVSKIGHCGISRRSHTRYGGSILLIGFIRVEAGIWFGRRLRQLRIAPGAHLNLAILICGSVTKVLSAPVTISETTTVNVLYQIDLPVAIVCAKGLGFFSVCLMPINPKSLPGIEL